MKFTKYRSIGLVFGMAALAFVTLPPAFAGDPVPGIDISLEQIPGGIKTTVGKCRSDGGKVVQQGGKWVCTGVVKTTKTESVNPNKPGVAVREEGVK